MTNGLRVAKGGKDVTSTDPNDALYSSGFISPKMLIQNEGRVTTDGSGGATVFIEHGLTYSPAYFVYVNPAPSAANTTFPMTSAWGLADNIFAFVTSLPQKLRLDLQSCDTNSVYRYAYIILVEPARNG